MPEDRPRLVGIAGPLKGATFVLEVGECLIGREASNQIWARDAALSRRHCAISSDGAQFAVQDLKSRNGTFVNGINVEAQVLSHGDQITVGESTLLFLLDHRGPRTQASPVKLLDTAELSQTVALCSGDALYLKPRAQLAPDADRAAQDLNSLLRIALGIGGIRDWESLQWQLLGFVFDIVPADRGAVLLFSDLEKVDSIAAWDRVRGPDHAVYVSRTVLRRVMQTMTGLLVRDLPADDSLNNVPSVDGSKIRSLICVPLAHAGSVMGAIYLDSKEVEFDQHHLEVMTAVAAIASLALDNVRHWERLRQENQELRTQIDLENNMVGEGAAMREVQEFVRRAAAADSTVLIQGESGTGKELVARALHRNSARAEQPFVAINCATLSEALLESELFGHEKGA
ncbi:MAG TPA: sigma 54-interacting transcriptional regulator, partial [Terriglobales bacterium]